MIPFSSPKAQFLSHRKEIEQAISDTLESGWYILGQQTRYFEEEFAAYIGAKYAVGVGSGTEAIHLALKACGVGPGDEVITVSHTAVATVSAIELTGALPVLVDIEYDYFTLDPHKVESAISAKTRAIIAVHLYGQPAEMSALTAIARKNGLTLIEDCAQAHGATYQDMRVGSIGDISCFSFYPTKNLGAIGDGGAVLTNRDDLAEKVRLLREYGWGNRYLSDLPGWNSRLDEIQAAILRVKLRTLEADNAKRLRLANLYDEGLTTTEIVVPSVRRGATHVFHLYVVRVKARDKLIATLNRKGIGFGIHYPVPIHLQKAYKGRLRLASTLSITESAAYEIISLPMYPELLEEDLQSVVDTVISSLKY